MLLLNPSRGHHAQDDPDSLHVLFHDCGMMLPEQVAVCLEDRALQRVSSI